jgi:hypothetical protein
LTEEERVFKFLDDLRESGLTNMFGALPFVLEMFPELPRGAAKDYLIKWMKTFSDRHPVCHN